MGAGRPWDPCLQGHRAQLHPLPSQGELTPHPAPPTSKGTGQRCGQQGPRAGAGHRQPGTCTPHPTAGEEPAERPPNLGNLAALQETGNMGDVSWRGKYTKLLGDQGVKRMDAQDFLWLLNDPPPPCVLEPNCSLLVVADPHLSTQPLHNPRRPALLAGRWGGSSRKARRSQTLHPPLSEPRAVRPALLLPSSLLPSPRSPCPALRGTGGSGPAWTPFGERPSGCPACARGEKKGPETPAPLPGGCRVTAGDARAVVASLPLPSGGIFAGGGCAGLSEAKSCQQHQSAPSLGGDRALEPQREARCPGSRWQKSSRKNPGSQAASSLLPTGSAKPRHSTSNAKRCWRQTSCPVAGSRERVAGVQVRHLHQPRWGLLALLSPGSPPVPHWSRTAGTRGATGGTGVHHRLLSLPLVTGTRLQEGHKTQRGCSQVAP